MTTKRGVYGKDDVAWEVQEARDIATDNAYRKNPEAFDAPERLSIKRSMIYEHERDGGVYQDGENNLYLGYEKHGGIRTFAVVDFRCRHILFAPLAISARYLVKWAPMSQVINEIDTFKMTAPRGCL